MSEIVKLPREVAEAIRNVRKRYKSGCEYDLNFLAKEKWGSMLVITMFVSESSENMIRYFQALVNGYEVEQTPEEKVREYYELNNPDEYMNQNQFNIQAAVREGVLNTLNLLNIKIKGVND